LCASEPQEQQRPLIEPTPEQAGDVVNEKTEAAIEIHDHGCTNNYPTVIISYDIKICQHGRDRNRAAGSRGFDASPG
jgi:hypothetical protein